MLVSIVAGAYITGAVAAGAITLYKRLKEVRYGSSSN